MGYHATGSGRLTFTKNVECVKKMIFGKETGDEIIEDLCCNWFSYECDFYDTEDSIYLWHPDDWNYRDGFIEVLEKLAAVTKKGCIEFTGEDDCHWCVEFNPQTSHWEEKNGRVIYEDEIEEYKLLKKDFEVVKNAFASYVDNDLAVCELDYVRSVLTDMCGLDKGTIRLLGFDYMFDD